MTTKHTPGPWTLGEFDETGGYDCMTAGITAGPVTVDGANYGERWYDTITEDLKARMLADARLIAATPELLEALQMAEQFMGIASDWNIDEAEINGEMRSTYELLDFVRAAIAKATAQ